MPGTPTTYERVELVDELICDTCGEPMRHVVRPRPFASRRHVGIELVADDRGNFLHSCVNGHEAYAPEVYPRTRVELRVRPTVAVSNGGGR